MQDADDVAREARLARARRATQLALQRAVKQKAEARAAKDAARKAARAAEVAARKAARVAAQRTLTEEQRNEAWTCVLCGKSFATAATFRAHHVHKFASIERCLDSLELRALGFTRTKAGIWGEDITTQTLPSQVARLASVRQETEMARFLAGGYGSPTGASLMGGRCGNP
jgi:hypothetical protein